eukprot:scaffold92914_cov27-Prasinocladus_malaysianus.AAC.3
MEWNVDCDGQGALHVACVAGYASVVRVMLAWGAKNGVKLSTPDANSATPLLLATVQGNVEVVRALLEAQGEDLDLDMFFDDDGDDDDDDDDEPGAGDDG